MALSGEAGDRDRELRPQSARESILAYLVYVLRVFTTRFWVFLSVVLLVLAAMAYATLRMDSIYRATAILLIERQTSNLRSLEDPMRFNTDDIDYYNTQVKILQGPGLAQVVAEQLKLRERGWGEDASDAVQRGIDVTLARNNRIVEVSFEHKDRHLAAEIANKLVDAYEEQTRERRQKTIDNLRIDLDRQLNNVKQELDQREREVLVFYAQFGLHLGDERESALERMMNDAGLTALRARQDVERLETITRALDSAGDDVDAVRAVAVAHGMLTATDELQVSYSSAQQELARLAAEFKDPTATREYREAAARLDEVRRKRQEQAKLLISGITLQRHTARKGLQRAEATFEQLHQRRLVQDWLLAQAEILRRNRDATRELFDALNLRVKEAGISSKIDTPNIHRLRPAIVPKAPVRPSLTFNMLVALVVAVIAGAASIVLLDRVDNTVRTSEDVESVYDLPVLSVVPLGRIETMQGPPALACWKDEQSQIAEAFRRVRAAILLSVRSGGQGGPIRRILISSPGPAEGKTITASNLAISLAQMGMRTLLLDCDFYLSETHKYFNLDREKGLSTLLVSDIALSEAIQPTPVPYLDFLATGMIPPQPAGLLGSARMRWVLEEATRTYDRVVIDTAPLVAVTDASLLAPQADATLLVVREGKTSRTALHRALQTLSRISVRPLGFVFNGVRAGVGQFYFKYHHPSYDLEPAGHPPPVAPER